MNIGRVNSFRLNPEPKEQKQLSVLPLINSNQTDVFECSRPAFLGAKSYNGGSQVRKIKRTLEENGIDVKNLAEIFDAGISMLQLSGYGDYAQEVMSEGYLISFVIDNRLRTLLRNSKAMPLETFNRRMITSPYADANEMSSLVIKSGIQNTLQLDNFLRLCYDNPTARKVFANQAIEAVNIYSLLNNKQNLSRFAELTLYLYNAQYTSDDPDYDIINRQIEFLNKFGINEMSGFDKKFSYLAPDFNEFGDISDKVDAIEWLMATYEDKMNLLAEPLSGDRKKAEKIYAEIPQIIDIIYKTNDEKSLGDIEGWILAPSVGSRLKAPVNKLLAPAFNNFENPEDYIAFYKHASDCGFNIKDLNVFLSQNYISDINPSIYLFNFKNNVSGLSGATDLSEEEAREFYINFKEPVSLFLNEDDPDSLDDFVKFAKDKQITSTQQFIELYNRTFPSRKKALSSDEFKEFFNLVKNVDFKEVQAKSSALRKPVSEILKMEKDGRHRYTAEIASFIQADKSDFFIGRTPDDIYDEYKALFSNPWDVKSVLSNLKNFSIQSSDEYTQKAEKIALFSDFFDNNLNQLAFVKRAKFKFNDSKSDNAYIDTCFTVLDLVSNNPDERKAKERLNFYTTSKFFPASKANLDAFLVSIPHPNVKDILDFIADNKIQSVKEIQAFVDSLADEEGNTENVYQFLSNLKDKASFKNISETLERLNASLSQINLKQKIDNSNILNISPEFFTKKGMLGAQGLNSLAGEALGLTDKDSLFVLGLKDASVNKKPEKYTKFKIARDIARNAGSNNESYRNLLRILKIDRKSLDIDPKASQYLYVRAIEDKLDDKFIDFVNSSEWLNYDDNKKTIPAFSLHARLRLIDRYALEGKDNIDELYKPETIKGVKSVLKQIYEKSPLQIKPSEYGDGRFYIDTNVNNWKTHIVFSPIGHVITLFPRWENYA